MKIFQNYVVLLQQVFVVFFVLLPYDLIVNLYIIPLRFFQLFLLFVIIRIIVFENKFYWRDKHYSELMPVLTSVPWLVVRIPRLVGVLKLCQFIKYNLQTPREKEIRIFGAEIYRRALYIFRSISEHSEKSLGLKGFLVCIYGRWSEIRDEVLFLLSKKSLSWNMIY